MLDRNRWNQEKWWRMVATEKGAAHQTTVARISPKRVKGLGFRVSGLTRVL